LSAEPYDFELADDLHHVRGGIDSLAWMLNNVHNVGTPEWDALLASAREDAQRGRDALQRLELRLRGDA
jgi:hypothetical protein